MGFGIQTRLYCHYLHPHTEAMLPNRAKRTGSRHWMMDTTGVPMKCTAGLSCDMHAIRMHAARGP